VPALDPDQRGDLAPLVDADDVVGRQGQGERLGVAADQAVDEVDLLQGLADRGAGLARPLRRDEGRPELGADPALAQPRDVGVQRLLRPGDVQAAEEGVGAVRAQLVGQVVVAVDDQRLAVDAEALRGQFHRAALAGGLATGGRVGRARGQRQRQERQDTDQPEQSAFHEVSGAERALWNDTRKTRS
jgi:hypothetical protein